MIEGAEFLADAAIIVRGSCAGEGIVLPATWSARASNEMQTVATQGSA